MSLFRDGGLPWAVTGLLGGAWAAAISMLILGSPRVALPVMMAVATVVTLVGAAREPQRRRSLALQGAVFLLVTLVTGARLIG